jgi:predicted alpha/beta hydrolase family esterase
MPLYKLPFPSIVVASSNDEYVTLERAKHFADSWGSELINAGNLGHINSSSDLGNWPFGISLLQKLI